MNLKFTYTFTEKDSEVEKTGTARCYNSGCAHSMILEDIQKFERRFSSVIFHGRKDFEGDLECIGWITDPKASSNYEIRNWLYCKHNDKKYSGRSKKITIQEARKQLSECDGSLRDFLSHPLNNDEAHNLAEYWDFFLMHLNAAGVDLRDLPDQALIYMAMIDRIMEQPE